MAETRPGRLRIKAACEPCRSRKRKCDGQMPCALCLRYEYDCYYADQTRKRKGTRSVTNPSSQLTQGQTSTSSSKINQTATTSSPENHERNMIANAGSLFPHILGARATQALHPGSSRVCSVGWNLELRQQNQSMTRSPCQLLSLEDYQTLANVYFERIHPVYGFITRSTFDNRVLVRWQHPDAPCDDFDTVIYGIAALGAVFVTYTTTDMDEELAELAKSVLDSWGTARHPSITIIKGWLLRTLYLRITSTPQASWMASCVTMHLLEDAGIHQEDTNRSMVYPDHLNRNEEVENCRRLFWLTYVLNTWISQEYGRSKVKIVNMNCQKPSPIENDYTTDLISVFDLSESIDPTVPIEPALLEQRLIELNNMNFQHDAVKLSQSNLALAFYRRLRVTTSSLSNTHLAITIRLGLQGLEAALRLADNHCPWWHVLNQPFQFLCILLAIDSRESIAQVPHAFATLNNIGSKFGNAAVREAVETAQLLVRICRERKQREATNLIEIEASPNLLVGQSVGNFPEVAPSSSVLPPEVDLNLNIGDDLFTQIVEEFDWDSFLSLPGNL